MAGVAGKSGGPRKNSGGARPGAGRKPNPPVTLVIPVPVAEDGPVVSSMEMPPGVSLEHKDPKIFLLALMNDLDADVKLRADAAKSLMPFMHQKLGEGGKKEQRQKDAEKVGGRFSAGAPPKLAAVGGRKV